MKSTLYASLKHALRFTMNALVAVSLLSGATSALRAQVGVPYTWGWNSDGQIGDNTNNNRLSPFKITKVSHIVQVAHSGISSFVRRSDGTVWGWGANEGGQLGIGTTNPAPYPTKIATLSSIGDVSASPYHTLAVKSDGTVWAWGNNDAGQIGDGTTNSEVSPIQVSGMSKAIRVAAGDFHSLALKTDGTVWGWGYNGFGEVGNNTEDNQLSPVQALGLSGIVQISAGEFHSLALKSDGTVWAWGSDQSGQFGDGTTNSSDSPEQVPGLSGIVQIAAGGYHSLFLKSDGTVWAAGFNISGQLGDGTTDDNAVPQQVTGLTNIVQIAAGDSHSMALRADGTVWAWGTNGEGELGDGDTTGSAVPVQVQGLTQQTYIAAGYQHSLSVQATMVAAKLSASNVVTRYGQSIKASVFLKDGSNNLPLIQKAVTITLNGTSLGVVTTDASGRASIVVPNPNDYDVGDYVISASFAGDSLYLPTTGAGTLTVNPDGSSLAGVNVSAYLGATTNIKASLLDSVSASPLAGSALSISLDGSVIGNITTSSTGKATLSYFVDSPLTAGSHVLKASFAGDQNNSAANWTGKLTVLQTPTKMGGFYASGSAGATVSLQSKLLRTTDKKYLGGETIHYLIGGVEIGSAITNSSGVAVLSYTIPAGTASGRYAVTLSFNGDTNYQASSLATSYLTVK